MATLTKNEQEVIDWLDKHGLLAYVNFNGNGSFSITEETPRLSVYQALKEMPSCLERMDELITFK